MKNKIIKGLLIIGACASCFFIGTTQAKTITKEITKTETVTAPIPENYIDITAVNGWDQVDTGEKIQLIIETDKNDYIIEKTQYSVTVSDTYINSNN